MGASVGVVTEVGVDTAGHLVEFGDDAVLLALEHGERDRVGVVRLHEAVLLAFEPVAVGGEAFQFLGFRGHEPVELVVEHPRECVLLSRRDLDARVVVLDELLDVLDEHRLARAVGALGVAPGAYEVAVHVAVAVLRVGDDEPGAALAAVDGAFEVVAVDLGCLDGALVRGEHGLDLVPDLGRHERRVVALVAGAPVDDIALVVRVGQEAMDGGHGQGLRRPLRRGQAAQSARGEFVVELADAPVPGGVCLEGPLDHGRALGVEFDGAELASHLVALADVEVADGSPSVRAATDGLLGHALGDLGGEVAGVELGDCGHDAVQQHPGGRLVDVLCRGYEHDPALLECEVDAHVVGAVAGEPVDLVDDAVGDLVGLDVLDHPHQLGPVG
ncbi:MAG: hypothetical protein M9952_01670 [Microthrixaceae bacterium]|nr:hypothetical protein [Microthrixaceae bacterium]